MVVDIIHETDMNPLKVKWLRRSARLRLFHAWILVQLGLHRRAPSRFRVKFTRAADWLEATLELMAAQSGGQGQLQHQGHQQGSESSAASKAYGELQRELAAIHDRGQHIREDIENIKSKFIALLDLCGIKDADIPLFDEPNCVRHSHQTLITHFGIMSKSSPSTPQRTRNARRDPSVYADMLIEQLMAQANSVTDSDTSPPSTEETAGRTVTTMDAEQTEEARKKSNNNNDDKVIPLQLQFSTPTPSQKSSIPSSRLSPATVLQHHIPVSREGEENAHSHKDTQHFASTCHQYGELRGQPYAIATSDASYPIHYHASSSSGVTGSEHSHTAVTCTYVSVCRREGAQQGSATTTLQNTTSGSTPELPTSESSDSLDIPFASLFDQIDCPENVDLASCICRGPELVHDSTEYNLRQNPASPVLPQASYYSFPVRYSHSYARELHIIESENDLPAGPTPTPQKVSPLGGTPSRPSTSACDSGRPAQAAADSKSLHESHFVFHEPLVVCLPPKSEPRPSKHVIDRHDNNIDKNYKPHLSDKNTEVESDIDIERPPIPPRRPLTDTKLGRFIVRSQSSEVGTLWLSSSPSKAVHFSEKQICDMPRSASDNTVQHSCKDSHQTETKSVFVGGMTNTSENFSPRNVSWSYHDLPSLPNEPQNSMVSMSTGKAHYREKHRATGDRFITVRPRQLASPPEAQSASRSASKRRKGNDRAALPVSSGQERTLPHRSARQRLSFTPVSSPTRSKEIGMSAPRPDSTTSSTHFVLTPTTASPQGKRMRKKKRQSPAMRRLMQQKENNNILSPSLTSKANRKPFGELYNIQLNDSDLLTTSSNSLTPSSEAYAKSSETSPDTPLPSREEELLDRDAYYCDFTVDRQHKIDTLISNYTHAPSSNEDQESQYTIEDPVTNEFLVRKVEGAESSPSSFVFQAPPASLRAPRAAARTQKRYSSSDAPSGDAHSSRGRTAVSHDNALPNRRSCSTRSSSGHSHQRHSSQSSQHSSQRSSRASSKNSSPVRSRSSSSRSSRSSSRKSCTTHPIASSTLIMDPDSTSPEVDTGSVYTWSIDEESSPCNLEKSYIRSTSAKKKRRVKPRNNFNTPRPPTSVGQDSPNSLEEDMGRDKNAFEITAMVSRIHETMNSSSLIPGKQIDSMCEDTTIGGSPSRSDLQISIPRTSTRSSLSSRCILAAAPSLLRNLNNMSKNGTGQSQLSEATTTIQSSNVSSNQATTSSMFFNRAKASIICSSNEGSDFVDQGQLSYEPLHSRHISASEPDLRYHYYRDDENATYSLIPTDTDSTRVISDSSMFEERLDIPGKSSTSGSSSCTAARCRPRVTKKSPEKLSEAAGVSGVLQPPAEFSGPSQPGQDLMDSILTDSPKSVDSSGIFAPYNSYNSPVESVGSHNGYSSTISSSVTSSDTNYTKTRQGLIAPPPTPPHTRPAEKASGRSTFVAKPQQLQEKGTTTDIEFKRPFAPAPHVDLVSQRPSTRNQGVTAGAVATTPHRPLSVRSDPLANKSVFAVQPGVVTGPPKIKDKKSLVRKFKKFSSHFYKKTEKIQTLANL